MDVFDEFLRSYPPEVQAVCQKLRDLVKSTTPEVREVLYASQNHIAFSLTEAVMDQVIYLVPMNGYVRLGFFWGGKLPDQNRILTGTGKRLRHVKIRTVKEVDQPGLKDLIEAAWADAEARTLKKKLQ